MIDTIQIDAQALLTFDRDRIEETQALDVTAATRTARISSNEVVEGTLFSTRSCKTNRYHFLLALIQILFCPGARSRENAVFYAKFALCEVKIRGLARLIMAADGNRGDKPLIHQGADHSAPYPVSRLAPGFGLVDLAREIEQADQMVASRMGSQLQVIAEQVKALQTQAHQILARAHEDQRLHHARCSFRRIPGHVYHLYEEPDGSLAFSMLSPADWHGQPPKPFCGSYRLENDMSWAPADGVEQPDDSRQLIARLLATRDGTAEGND